MLLPATLVASSLASAGLVTSPALPAVGLDRPTDRALTLANAIAIHDGIRHQSSAKVLGEQSFASDTLAAQGRNRASNIHPFWIWLTRLGTCLGALLIVVLSAKRWRSATGFLALTVAVVVCAVVAILLDTLNTVRTASDAADRLRRAEWQWKLDLARAASMPDPAAGRAALDAVERYSKSVDAN
jgi:hypothetical protein